MTPTGCPTKLQILTIFLYISKYTCCTVFATSRESIYKPNCGWRYSTNFRTPWYHRRPPPQMFKVYIVSRWIWADLRAIRLRAVIVSVDAGASLGGLPATHWMSGLRNVVMALRSRSPDFPRHCPPRKLSLWFSSLLPKFWLRGLACACARGTSTRRRRFWDQCGTIFHARVELLQWERGRKESASPFFTKALHNFFLYHLIPSAWATALLPGLPEAAHDVVQVRLGHVRHVVRQLQLVRHVVPVLTGQRPHHRAAHPLQKIFNGWHQLFYEDADDCSFNDCKIFVQRGWLRIDGRWGLRDCGV